MEFMAQPQCDRPFTERIDSKLTGFEMKHRPHGQPCTMRFRLCSVSFAREYHYIGPEGATKVEHDDELVEGQELELAHLVDGGPAVFRACRGAIRQMLMEALPALNVDCAEEGRWDELVPAGLVEGIVKGVAPGATRATCGCTWG
jgi:hypothetical protein